MRRVLPYRCAYPVSTVSGSSTQVSATRRGNSRSEECSGILLTAATRAARSALTSPRSSTGTSGVLVGHQAPHAAEGQFGLDVLRQPLVDGLDPGDDVVGIPEPQLKKQSSGLGAGVLRVTAPADHQTAGGPEVGHHALQFAQG